MHFYIYIISKYIFHNMNVRRDRHIVLAGKLYCTICNTFVQHAWEQQELPNFLKDTWEKRLFISICIS